MTNTVMDESDPPVLQTVIAEVTAGLSDFEDDQGLALPCVTCVLCGSGNASSDA